MPTPTLLGPTTVKLPHLSNALFSFSLIFCLTQPGAVITPWRACMAIYRGLFSCQRLGGTSGRGSGMLTSCKAKGNPAQDTVLPKMPRALFLRIRPAHPPTATKLLTHLSLSCPKVQNKPRSSRWHWPSLVLFSLFIRQACKHAHTYKHTCANLCKYTDLRQKEKCPLPVALFWFWKHSHCC